MTKRMIPGIFAGFGVLLLILDSRTALIGAQTGIELCIYSVIPSIFPFIVLTGVLTPAICGRKHPILRPISKILGIPTGSEGLFLTGILGGYPTGALAVHQAWQDGQLSKNDALRMLAFCSNAGPAFLFGILGSKFPETWMLWLLWGIHILSAVLVGILLPGKSNEPHSISAVHTPTLTDSVKRSVVSMGYICGWIVLFRVILAFCDRWFLWLLPKAAQVGFYGILELANGCSALDAIPSIGLRFVLCSAMLAFGGICVTMQTASVTGKLGLGLYLPGKVLQCLFSIMLSFLVQWLCFTNRNFGEICPVILPISLIFVTFILFMAGKRKIRGRNPGIYGV